MRISLWWAKFQRKKHMNFTLGPMGSKMREQQASDIDMV
jgi:hypothetical protein